MRLLKIQVSTKFLKGMGLGDLLSKFKRIEIINAYQYDKKNFFSMQKIVFPENLLDTMNDDELDQYIKKGFGATQFELLEKPDNNTLVCILKQKRFRGFWTIIPSGPWALVPPVIVDQKMAVFGLISTENFIKKLFWTIRTFTRKYKVLANQIIDDYSELSPKPYPRITQKQRDISTYAVRNGFYESPRKITAIDLAKKFNISVSTLNEHLRKTERIAMYYLFGEY